MIANSLKSLTGRVRRWNPFRQWNQSLRERQSIMPEHGWTLIFIKWVVIAVLTATAINVAIIVFLVVALP